MSELSPNKAEASRTDHDLLIRLDQKVDTLHDKVSKLTDDHEERIRDLESTNNQGKGRERIIGGIVAAAISLAIAYFFHR